MIEKGKDFYNDLYKKKKYRQISRSVWRYINTNYLKEGLKILDMGCGDGPFGRICVDAKCDYTGVDLSDVAIENAKILVPEAGFYCKDINADTELITNGDYDIITILEVLEHIAKDRELLSKIPRGKTIIFSVPTFWSKDHVRVFESPKDIIDRYNYLIDIHHIEKLYKRGRLHRMVVKGVKS